MRTTADHCGAERKRCRSNVVTSQNRQRRRNLQAEEVKHSQRAEAAVCWNWGSTFVVVVSRMTWVAPVPKKSDQKLREGSETEHAEIEPYNPWPAYIPITSLLATTSSRPTECMSNSTSTNTLPTMPTTTVSTSAHIGSTAIGVPQREHLFAEQNSSNSPYELSNVIGTPITLLALPTLLALQWHKIVQEDSRTQNRNHVCTVCFFKSI